MTGIHLFNHAEDAWEANLANWLEQRSKESFSGHETWFVTNSYLQGNWIRRMALSHRKTLFGIQFFDRRTLREHLCRRFGLPSPSSVPLQILLDAAAGQNPIEYTAARSLLDAIDDLGASGWLDHYGLDAAFSTLRIPEQLQPATQAVERICRSPAAPDGKPKIFCAHLQSTRSFLAVSGFDSRSVFPFHWPLRNGSRG